MAAKPNEIQITRVYDAPVKLVWEAWTDLKHVEKWWGPRGFTITTKSKDLRPGGKWIYTMHGPDGTDYPNFTTYHEVVPYEKLVYDHGGNEEREKLFSVTVTFKEQKGKTTMVMTMSVPTEAEAKAMKQFIKMANGTSTWDRLAEYLELEISHKDVFITHRTFDADIKTVFEAWINPDKFAKWLGPAGSSMSYLSVGVEEGGTSHWKMTSADGETKFGKLNYQKINPPHSLIYTQHFCDERGMICKPPFSETYPETLLTTVTFTEEGPQETRLSVKWEIVGECSDAESKTFKTMKPVMMGGWNGSFDKLEEQIKDS